MSALSPIASAFALLPAIACANCTTIANVTTCTAAAPNPYTATVGTGASTAANASLTLQGNAAIVVGNANAVSLGNSATINLNSGASIQNTATSGAGLYGTGQDTVETNNNGSINVAQGARIVATGTEHDAEAINVEGSGNVVTNNGTIQGVHSAAIWFQNATGTNTIINNATGIIESPINVIGSTANGAVDFTNRGEVIGNLNFAGGNDVLNLYTGSSISGSFNGGGGTNVINLMGLGSASLPGAIQNFQFLNKIDTGTWTLTGSITGGMVVTVQQGTLILAGNNAQFTGSVHVDSAGTLQGTSATLPPTVSNAGIVQFAQDSDGSYGGLITGTGEIIKSGTGVLDLTAASTDTGATIVADGTLRLDGSLDSKTVVDTGATLSGEGLIHASVINNGSIAPGDGGDAGALRIGGNYTGQGGIISVQTVVNAGGPGNEQTSRLLITGNAGGSTFVQVLPQSGSQAQITHNTSLSGISVVQVGGEAGLGAFSSGPYQVVLGPYVYRIFYFPSAYSASSELDPQLRALGVTSFNDYRLQSVTVQPYVPGLPMAPGPGGVETTTGGVTSTGVYVPAGLPVGFGPNGETAGQTEVVPQVLAYRALPMAAQQFGYALVDDLHRRMGEITQESGDAGIESFVRARNWTDTFESSDIASIGQNAWFVQFGLGRVFDDVVAPGDRLHVDAIASLGHGSLNVDLNSSNAQFDVESIGASATYQAAQGWYLDLVMLQSSYQNMTISTPLQGQVASTQGDGDIISLEGGYPLHLGDKLVLEPRAAIAYQHLGINQFTDADGVRFHLADGSSSQERIGLRLYDTFTRAAQSGTQLFSPFVTLDYVHDPQSSNHVLLGGVSFAADTTGSSLQATLGINAQLTHALAVYVDAERQIERGGRGATGTAANIGVRYTF